MDEKIIFATYYGSRLYGTAGPNSDTDIKGVFLPTKEDCLLCKAPKHFILNTNKSGANTKDDTDETYLSLQYFLELLTQGETNALDMFFSYTNREQNITDSPLYRKMIDNADKLITKNVSKYLGYVKSQAIKYSVKGDKLNNFYAFRDFLDNKTGHVLLKDALLINNVIKFEDLEVKDTSTEYMKGTKLIGKRNKIEDTPFGDHVYVLIAENKELYFMISDIKFQMNGTINENKGSLYKTLKSYGQRAENAANDKGADYKALSHAVRVLFQAEELLTTGKITFPLKGDQLKMVHDIKFRQTDMTYEQIVDFIEKKLKDIEENILPNTKLRSKPDYEFIKNLILDAYKD